ncbi:hypothetical protein [Paracraurococcus ruber]|uniref:PEP-CTERM protein-sorting domain-containing protein n=1 Tax=Paracraurococcus ruber TaxID=77675 RepID=A0ABS1D508_9PROT|nr:hypothetical protein [Paracraurococcus ruber]MBK1661636.1 hypothetical protein [Paracraurococcus ruber]TDG27089.1 hypothetical protein E2C05_24115 [Paracraurococcus ruber]
MRSSLRGGLAALLRVGGVVGAQVAAAAPYTISIIRRTGRVPGDVRGSIALPHGSGGFRASSGVATAAPRPGIGVDAVRDGFSLPDASAVPVGTAAPIFASCPGFPSPAPVPACRTARVAAAACRTRTCRSQRLAPAAVPRPATLGAFTLGPLGLYAVRRRAVA